MGAQNMGRRLLERLFYGYLKCLEKTVKITWIQPENLKEQQIIGFWHEDSFAMNLVLRHIAGEDRQISVLVTADARGDYIQYLVERCKGEAIRTGHGFGCTGMLKDVFDKLKKEGRSVAIAMDGPLGPRHIPKKMTYFLSEKGDAPLLGVTVDYSHKIALRGRWDHYRIPLPFSRLTIRFDNYGVVTSKCLPKIKIYQNERGCSIMNDGILICSEEGAK